MQNPNKNIQIIIKIMEQLEGRLQKSWDDTIGQRIKRRGEDK